MDSAHRMNILIEQRTFECNTISLFSSTTIDKNYVKNLQGIKKVYFLMFYLIDNAKTSLTKVVVNWEVHCSSLQFFYAEVQGFTFG